MRITWDERKRKSVLAERGVDFVDVSGVFEGPLLVREDVKKVYGEKRYIAIGRAEKGHFVVVFSRRQDALHIITAWRAGRNARRRYQELLA